MTGRGGGVGGTFLSAGSGVVDLLWRGVWVSSGERGGELNGVERMEVWLVLASGSWGVPGVLSDLLFGVSAL